MRKNRVVRCGLFTLLLCIMVFVLPKVICRQVHAAEANWLWPVPGYTTLTRGFSVDHVGLDVQGPYNAAILASKSGVVVKVLNGDVPGYWEGYGNGVVISHGDGYYSHYAHMASVCVSEGQSVSQGQQIGGMGSTGDSTGVHLHFEIATEVYGADAGGRINNNRDVIDYIYTTGSSPEGCVDLVEGGKGSINVKGWAFDRDMLTQSIVLHVYIGGPAGSGAPSYPIIADKLRSDVGAAYPGVGDYHGYLDTIYTNKTGEQPIYIYAINVGGGDNKLIGHTTVNIQGANPPVISEVKVIEQDSQGYLIQCKVTSEVGIDRVMCPTWSHYNSQDDLAPDWMHNTAVKAYEYGDYYRFRVNISEHNNEYGMYWSHIYAYDVCGNETCNTDVSAMLIFEIKPQEIVRYENKLISVFDENCSWTDENQFAGKMGSCLVSITNQEKQDVVFNLIKDRFRAYYNVGGYQASAGADWQWTSGESFLFTNWSDGQPDFAGSDEFYLSLIPSTGKWNDLPNNYTNSGFVTETSLDIEPDAVIEMDNKVYKFYSAAMPYNLAKRFCEENGGHLVCINSQEENDFIAEKVKELNHLYYIGASDEEVEGAFTWVSGESMTYQNWASMEPNNNGLYGAENYASINIDGTWSDVLAQQDTIGFIAEIEVASAPTKTPNPTNSVDDMNLYYGDVDKNGNVMADDALFILRYVVKLQMISDNMALDLADVNHDKLVDAADALETLKIVVKLRTSEKYTKMNVL